MSFGKEKSGILVGFLRGNGCDK